MNKTATRKAAGARAAQPPAEGELLGITELARELGISLRVIRF